MDQNLTPLGALHPLELSICETLAPLSTASMTLPPEEQVAVRDYVALFTAQGGAGVYRVASVRRTFTGETAVELEHAVCALGDAVIPGEGEIAGSAKAVIDALLAHQTAQAGGAPLWRSGEIAGEAARLRCDDHNLLRAVLDVAAGQSDCRLVFDQTAAPWTLSLVPMPAQPGCECRLTRNIESLSVAYDDSDLCTRLYCADLEAEPRYMDAQDMRCGVVCRTVRAGEDVPQEALRAEMARYLAAHSAPRVSIEIDALDLSAATGEPLDRLAVGRLCRVALPDYGVTLVERIIERRVSRVYGEPERVRLTLANRVRDSAQDFARLMEETTGETGHSAALSGGFSQGSLRDRLRAQETALTAQGLRVSQAEIDIDGANAAIALKASQSEVNALGERVRSAEIDIDGANAAILLKASQSEVNALDERMSSAEIDIDGANSEITLRAKKTYVDSEITAVRTLVAEEIDAAIADVNLSLAQTLVTQYLTVTGRATLGALALGGENVSKTSIPVVTSFTQASGEAAETTDYTLLTVAVDSDTAHTVAGGQTKAF